jgi:hypothetical protein
VYKIQISELINSEWEQASEPNPLRKKMLDWTSACKFSKKRSNGKSTQERDASLAFARLEPLAFFVMDFVVVPTAFTEAGGNIYVDSMHYSHDAYSHTRAV